MFFKDKNRDTIKRENISSTNMNIDASSKK